MLPLDIVIPHVFPVSGNIHGKLAEDKRQMIIKKYVTPFFDHGLEYMSVFGLMSVGISFTLIENDSS